MLVLPPRLVEFCLQVVHQSGGAAHQVVGFFNVALDHNARLIKIGKIIQRLRKIQLRSFLVAVKGRDHILRRSFPVLVGVTQIEEGVRIWLRRLRRLLIPRKRLGIVFLRIEILAEIKAGIPVVIVRGFPFLLHKIR